MCLFVAAILPPEVEPASFQPLIDRHGLGFAAIKFATPPGLLTVGERCYYATKRASAGASCDCGIELGSFSREPSSHDDADERVPPPPDDKAVRKKRKKGWSEARIRRWLEQLNGHRQRRAVERERQLDRAISYQHPTWPVFLNELIGRNVKYLGFLLHEYGGRVQSEILSPTRREVVPLAAADQRFLLQMQEDVIYEVRK